MSVDPKHLQILFESFGSKDDKTFVRAAEAIIERELAANHHGFANALRHALNGNAQVANTSQRVRELSVMPRDRRSGEDLLWLAEAQAGLEGLVLGREQNRAISRFLLEQRSRSRLRAHGLDPMNRLLFWGPPGNGKSATASALGFELGLPLATIRIDSIISSFLGDTASHLNRVFAQAASTPMVLLFDEVDSLAKRRDDPRDVGELKRVVNALIQLIDRSAHSQSIFVAASNHQQLLDPAIWRRFDTVIEFPMPAEGQRLDLIKRLLRDIRYKGDIRPVVRASNGLSFAEIERAVKVSLKSMVIEERERLEAAEISAALLERKKGLKKARN